MIRKDKEKHVRAAQTRDARSKNIVYWVMRQYCQPYVCVIRALHSR